MEELNNVPWAYRKISRTAIGEPPFSLCYGPEAILPTKFLYPKTRSEVIYDPAHGESLALEADLLEGKSDHAYIHLTNYQQMLRRRYNEMVKPRKFNKGDLPWASYPKH